MPARLVSFLLTFSLLLISQFAEATSFSVAGQSSVNPVFFGNFVSGGMLNLNTSSPSGPSYIEIVPQGTVVNFQLQVPICTILQGCPPETSVVTFGSKSTQLMNGGFIFSGTFTAPVTNGPVIVTFPVAMIGNLVAFQDLGNGVKGPEMFALNFKGSGTISLNIDKAPGGGDIIFAASANFTGTATTVPEPGSLGLFGTGLLGIAEVVRRKVYIG